MCGNAQIRFYAVKADVTESLGKAMIIHAVVQKWKIPNTLYVVVALKPANTITGWLSSVKRVALKRENTQIVPKVSVLSKM